MRSIFRIASYSNGSLSTVLLISFLNQHAYGQAQGEAPPIIFRVQGALTTTSGEQPDRKKPIDEVGASFKWNATKSNQTGTATAEGYAKDGELTFSYSINRDYTYDIHDDPTLKLIQAYSWVNIWVRNDYLQNPRLFPFPIEVTFAGEGQARVQIPPQIPERNAALFAGIEKPSNVPPFLIPFSLNAAATRKAPFASDSQPQRTWRFDNLATGNTRRFSNLRIPLSIEYTSLAYPVLIDIALNHDVRTELRSVLPVHFSGKVSVTGKIRVGQAETSLPLPDLITEVLPSSAHPGDLFVPICKDKYHNLQLNPASPIAVVAKIPQRGAKSACTDKHGWLPDNVPYEVFVRVKNIGSSTAPPSILRLALKNRGVADHPCDAAQSKHDPSCELILKEVSVSAIEPGGYENVLVSLPSLSGTSYKYHGLSQIMAGANADHAFKEGNEGNNESTGNVILVDPLPPLYLKRSFPPRRVGVVTTWEAENFLTSLCFMVPPEFDQHVVRGFNWTGPINRTIQSRFDGRFYPPGAFRIEANIVTGAGGTRNVYFEGTEQMGEPNPHPRFLPLWYPLGSYVLQWHNRF